MRRRWARGPTPPIPDDEDDVIPTTNHHDNSPSNNIHHSNSPTHQQTASNETRAQQTPPYSSDSEDKSSTRSPNKNSGSCAREATEEGSVGGCEWDEDDITREREEQMEPSRKRNRDSDSSGQEASCNDDTITGSNGIVERRQGTVGVNKCSKRSKFTCEEELEVEDLLAEEEQLMLETIDNHIPPGFDV